MNIINVHLWCMASCMRNKRSETQKRSVPGHLGFCVSLRLCTTGPTPHRHEKDKTSKDKTIRQEKIRHDNK